MAWDPTNARLIQTNGSNGIRMPLEKVFGSLLKIFLWDVDQIGLSGVRVRLLAVVVSDTENDLWLVEMLNVKVNHAGKIIVRSSGRKIGSLVDRLVFHDYLKIFKNTRMSRLQIRKWKWSLWSMVWVWLLFWKICEIHAEKVQTVVLWACWTPKCW